MIKSNVTSNTLGRNSVVSGGGETFHVLTEEGYVWCASRYFNGVLSIDAVNSN